MIFKVMESEVKVGHRRP